MSNVQNMKGDTGRKVLSGSVAVRYQKCETNIMCIIMSNIKVLFVQTKVRYDTNVLTYRQDKITVQAYSR